MNGSFQFEGSYLGDSIKAMEVVILTKNYSNYKYLWIENTVVKLIGEKGKFSAAAVTGSATQLVMERYDRLMLPYDKSLDSISMLMNSKSMEVAQKGELKKLRKKLDEDRRAAETNFIAQNPREVWSVKKLNGMSKSWGKETVQRLFNLLSDENRKTSYGKEILRYLALTKNLKIGDRFVDVELPDTKGEKIRLSDVKAKVILLEFWASSCGPCIVENPRLIKIYETYKNKGFEVFAISFDEERSKWIKAIEKQNLPWINVCDLKGWNTAPASMYNIVGIPDSYLIDSSGKIVARGLRGEALSDKLKELLPE